MKSLVGKYSSCHGIVYRLTCIRKQSQAALDLATTVDTVDLTTGKVVRVSRVDTVFKTEELSRFTKLLALPCVLNGVDEAEMTKLAAHKKKKKRPPGN
jgi:hypothetical protein